MTPQRTIPPLEADERATLTAFLDFQRATLALKCDGLTEPQLKERAVPPSGLSLLGLVRHMAEVERNHPRDRPRSALQRPGRRRHHVARDP